MIFGNPYPEKTKFIASKLLTWSIIGLGFGMNLLTVAKVGFSGVGYTVIGITLTAIVGIFIGNLLNNKKDISLLVTFGTAICGGSAIAALSPTIKADQNSVSVSLAIVFLLNASALFIFPALGHYFHLTQEQFGLWSALAIHDTSSVVGASMQYGEKALEIGTTIKLARALWIVPVTLIVGFLLAKKLNDSNSNVKAQKPWFILGFLATAAIATWVPWAKAPGLFIKHISENALILTLFCIGANLTRQALKSVGIKPLIQGVILWFIMASITLICIYYSIISV
ncbi:MAG: putative sulfate exporter family transporter [Silvanigrellaceae bacterium]|nr:putative sulfate exporter family transporter [Silvanigrellaceae bacterium]